MKLKSLFSLLFKTLLILLWMMGGKGVAGIPGPPSFGSNYQLVWSQDFTTMTSLSQLGAVPGYTLGSGTWISHTPTAQDWSSFMDATTTNNLPFGVGNGYLDIRAQLTSLAPNPTWNGGYGDGLLSSVDSSGKGFTQQYGYFECSMQCPGRPNTWPAFWLLSLNDVTAHTTGYAAEIDITESFGNLDTGKNQSPAGNPNIDEVTWHNWYLPNINSSNSTSATSYVSESGMTTGFHTYGVDIEPTYTTWYFDRVQIYQATTLAAAKGPMYLLLDLALGGGNYNNSAGTGYNWALTPNPSDLLVKYVAVYASPSSPNYNSSTSPAITQQPANQSVMVGNTATFSVAATGSATLTYQWSKNGTAISGATSASYTTPTTVSGDNGSTFTVKVTNSYGNVTSNAAMLTVTGGGGTGSVAISEHFYNPQGNNNSPFAAGTSAGVNAVTNWNNLNLNSSSSFNATLNGLKDSTGTSVSTTFELSGTNADISNCWYNQTGGTTDQQVTQNFIQAGNDGGIAGAGTSLTLSINNIPYTTYTLIVYVNGAYTGAYGSPTTDTAKVTLSSSGTSYYMGAVGAASSGTPYSQVTKTTGVASSTADNKNYIEITGLTGTSQTFTMLDESTSANHAMGITGFQIVGTTGGGSGGNVPAITTQPTNTTVPLGQTATFTVEATGTATLTYQWSKNGTAISGATSASYTTPATVASDSGSTFTVKITNSYGNVTSNAATLTVTTGTGSASISEHFYESANNNDPFSSNTSAGVNEELNWNNLDLASSSSFNTTLSGLKDNTGTSVSTTFELSGSNANTSNVWYNQTGGSVDQQVTENFAQAGNDAGTPGSGSSLTLSINSIPYTTYTLIVYVNGAYTGAYGSPTTDTAKVTLSSSGTSYYMGAVGPASSGTPYGQVTKTTGVASSTADNQDYIMITGLTGTSQTLTMLDESTSANHAMGITGFQIVSTAGNAPAITMQPVSTSVQVGQTATFNSMATGSPAVTYQWSKNGTAISGATSASYTTPATVSGDNGATFKVVVTNTYGSVTSSTVTLTVTSGGGGSTAISEHFYDPQGNNSDPFASGTSAGVNAVTNWNNLDIGSSSSFNATLNGLKDSTGTSVSTTFELSGTNADISNCWYNQTGGTTDQQVTQNFVQAGNDGGTAGAGSSLTLSINSIPYSTYTLIIYLNGGYTGAYGSTVADTAKVTLSSSGTSYYMGAIGPASSGSPYSQVTKTTGVASSTADNKNYIEITGLTGTSQTITVLDESTQSNHAMGISGFQIIQGP